jgi:hypothetical protein
MDTLHFSLEKSTKREFDMANEALQLVRKSADGCLSLATRSHARALQFTLRVAGRVCGAAVGCLAVVLNAWVPHEDASNEPPVSPKPVAPFRPKDDWRPGGEFVPGD